MPLRVSPRLFAAISDTTRNAVSLDNFDKLALYWASVFAEDQLDHAWTAVRASAAGAASSASPSVRVGCCPPPALSSSPPPSFASIYKGQQRMKRELDIMCEQVDDMQVKLDAMDIEIAALKKRRR